MNHLWRVFSKQSHLHCRRRASHSGTIRLPAPLSTALLSMEVQIFLSSSVDLSERQAGLTLRPDSRKSLSLPTSRSLPLVSSCLSLSSNDDLFVKYLQIPCRSSRLGSYTRASISGRNFWQSIASSQTPRQSLWVHHSRTCARKSATRQPPPRLPRQTEKHFMRCPHTWHKPCSSNTLQSIT